MSCATPPSSSDQDDLFSIQDFTTVSPFEKIIKLLQRQLRLWSIADVWNSFSPVKLSAILPINELEKRHYVRLTATRMKPLKCPTVFYAKASKYQRWFNLNEYFALEFLYDKNGDRVGCLRFETANTLLNAFGIALKALGLPDVPVLVCRDGGPSDHHLGFKLSFEESSSRLCVSEFQAISHDSGEELLHTLLDLLKEPDLDSAQTRMLNQIVSKDIHLAAVGLLSFAHLRTPLPAFNPQTHMRWVYVVEGWPSLTDLIGNRAVLSEELADLTPVPSEEILPIRSLHVFFTWSFPFCEAVKLRPLPEGALVSLRPLFALDPHQAPFTGALRKLFSLADQSKALHAMPLHLFGLADPDPNLATTPPQQSRTAKHWLSRLNLYNTRLSLGERLVFIACTQLDSDFVADWHGLLQFARCCLRRRQPLIDLRSQLLLTAGAAGPSPRFSVSRFPVARHLDTVMIASMKAHLRLRLEVMDAAADLPGRLAYALVGLVLTPTPCSPERETMITERIAQAEFLKLRGKQGPPLIDGSEVTDQDLRIHSSFIRGAILAHMLLSARSGSGGDGNDSEHVASLSDFYALWRSITGSSQTDDRSARGLDPGTAPSLEASKLWQFAKIVAETRHPTLTDFEFLFPDEIFDAEKSLLALEDMTVGETLEAIYGHLLHRSCRLIYTQTQELVGAPQHILKPLTKCVGVQAAKQLCKWQPDQTTVIPTLQRIKLDDAIKRDQITQIITHTERLLLVSAAIFSKLEWLQQPTVIELSQTCEDELVLENDMDRECVVEVLRRSGSCLSMEDLTPTSGDVPPPFLKEFVVGDHTYCSWSDEEFRVAWSQKKII